jgi:hypothetical protein
MVHFFIGLDHPSTALPFLRSMISINTIRDRKGSLRANDWMMDSGGYTELSTHGRWSTSPQKYAENLVAAVTQDLMCEPFILDKTGLTIEEHQKNHCRSLARSHKRLRHARSPGLFAPILRRTP